MKKLLGILDLIGAYILILVCVIFCLIGLYAVVTEIIGVRECRLNCDGKANFCNGICYCEENPQETLDK